MRNRVLIGLLLATAFGRSATAARPAADSTQAPTHAPRPWYRPRHLLLQTAGGLGMITAGTGYAYAKNRLETDLLFGYEPKKYAGSALTVYAVKMLYSPFRLSLAKKWQLLPLTIGAYFSHTHNTINDGVKGQYYKDYYWFSHDNRYGPILGSRLTFLAPPIAATGQPRKLSFYYELGTNDLYFVSYTTNPTGLSFSQILTLALGVKADF